MSNNNDTESCTSNLTDDKTAAEDATTVAAAEESNEEQATKDGPFKEVDCSAEVVAAGTDASQKSADASWIDLEMKNLKSKPNELTKQVTKLVEVISRSPGEDWEPRAQALKDLTKLFEKQPASIQGDHKYWKSCLKALLLVVVSQLADPRSVVVGDACNMLAALAGAARGAASGFVYKLLLTISPVLGSGVPLISLNMHQAMQTVLTLVPIKNYLTWACSEIAASKSDQLRALLVSYFAIVLQFWGAAFLVKEVGLLVGVLADLLVDRSPKVREEARLVFLQLYISFHSNALALWAELPERVLKGLRVVLTSAGCAVPGDGEPEATNENNSTGANSKQTSSKGKSGGGSGASKSSKSIGGDATYATPFRSAPPAKRVSDSNVGLFGGDGGNSPIRTPCPPGGSAAAMLEEFEQGVQICAAALRKPLAYRSMDSKFMANMRRLINASSDSELFGAAERVMEESLWHGRSAFSKDGSGNLGSFVKLKDEHAQEVAGLFNLYNERKVDNARIIAEREHASLRAETQETRANTKDALQLLTTFAVQNKTITEEQQAQVLGAIGQGAIEAGDEA